MTVYIYRTAEIDEDERIATYKDCEFTELDDSLNEGLMRVYEGLPEEEILYMFTAGPLQAKLIEQPAGNVSDPERTTVRPREDQTNWLRKVRMERLRNPEWFTEETYHDILKQHHELLNNLEEQGIEPPDWMRLDEIDTEFYD